MIVVWTSSVIEWSVRAIFLLLGGSAMYALMYVYSPKLKELLKLSREFRESVGMNVTLQGEIMEIRKCKKLLEEQNENLIQLRKMDGKIIDTLRELNEKQSNELKKAHTDLRVATTKIDELFGRVLKLEAEK